ncbi:MAG: cell division protein FtsZ [Pseudobutyrivibrio sp.]|nr:cell division protein FtsZ [Pseudobutyrivibrio sp.]
MIQIVSEEEYKAPKVLVIGIGGGGNNAINRMMEQSNYKVTYVAVNTDKMVLDNSHAQDRLAIGEKLTGGYGAGGDPEIGAASAEESAEEIEALVKGAQMVVLTAGMGGGTGTGATPVIAKICKELKILTVAVVTKPFSFESRKKMDIAETGIAKLKDNVDTLFIIPNNRLLELNDKTLDLNKAFLLADSVLQNTLIAITSIIFNCGVIHLDFNDLRTVLMRKGISYIGLSNDYEGNDIVKAIEVALNSPFLETSIQGASYVLVTVSGKINLLELNAAVESVQDRAGKDAYIMWGTVEAEDDSDNVGVTIIATGMEGNSSKPVFDPTPIIPDPIFQAKPNLIIPPKATIKEDDFVIPKFILDKTGRK